MYRGVPQAHTTTIVGNVLDAGTGRPIVDARVAARWPARQGRFPTDAGGRFRLEWVEPGRVTLDVNCPSRTSLGPHVLDTAVVADTGKILAVELRIDGRRCAEPDSGSRRIRVRGVYSAGFEESRFVPCVVSEPEQDSLWRAPHLRRAWISFAPRLRGREFARWPKPKSQPFRATENEPPRYPTWYVDWSGTFSGPGRFGHMGVSPYELRVDSVATVRLEVPSSCKLVAPLEIP